MQKCTTILYYPGCSFTQAMQIESGYCSYKTKNTKSTSIKATRITIYKAVRNKITSEQLCIMEYRKIDPEVSAELVPVTLSSRVEN